MSPDSNAARGPDGSTNADAANLGESSPSTGSELFLADHVRTRVQPQDEKPADDGYSLAPLTPEQEAKALMEPAKPARENAIEVAPPSGLQFSLTNVMTVMAICAVEMAIGKLVPPGVFAFVAGLFTLAILVVAALIPGLANSIKLVWGCTMAVYFLAVLRAIISR